MATTLQPATGETTKQLINYRNDNGVTVIEMCDPPANTYTYEMNRQLDDAILKARMDNDAHVIVLTGSGDKFFSAGANIKMLASVDPTFKYYFCLHANETLLRLEHTPKLVIAALNGHCVGGGLEIAMAADLRIARKDTTPLAGFDENMYAENANAGGRTLQSLKDELNAVRSSTDMLLGSLNEDQLSATGTASNKSITANAIAFVIFGHLLHHKAIIKERYLAQ